MTPSDIKRLPGECVLWQGRPDWRALARDALHIRLVALYLALMLIWGIANDRADGLSPSEAALAAIPGLLLALGVLASVALFAWACARTTRYTITSERCLIAFGIALQATLSIPWRRVAMGSVAIAADGTGNIALTLKPGPKINPFKLWPHVRIIPRATAPMLRAVPEAAVVGALITQAAEAAGPVRLAPVEGALPVIAVTPTTPEGRCATVPASGR